MYTGVKKMVLKTLNKIKYNVGEIPDNLKFKYELLNDRIKNCKSCLDKWKTVN